jgi:hypothetical protein
MNQAFEQLCEKYELSEEIQTDFKNLFESEIIKVFYKMSMKEDVKDVKGKDTKKLTATKTKSKSSDSEICAGKKANGDDCTFKAKENGYCGRHDPDKTTKSSSSANGGPKIKKSAHECNAIIPKTKKPCSQPGTVKPDDAEFYYCKRHSENWTNFEQEPETKLVDSEADDDNDEA